MSHYLAFVTLVLTVSVCGCNQPSEPVKSAPPSLTAEQRRAQVLSYKQEIAAKQAEYAELKRQYDNKKATGSFRIGTFTRRGPYGTAGVENVNERADMDTSLYRIQEHIRMLEDGLDYAIGWPIHQTRRLKGQIADLQQLDPVKNRDVPAILKQDQEALSKLLEKYGPCPPDITKIWGP